MAEIETPTWFVRSENHMNVLVLLSGGIDSSCCVAFYRRMGHDVTGVFVNYGQPVVQKEEQSANAIAKHYAVPLHTIRISGPSVEFQGEIPGRNAFLVFVALLYHPTFSGLLALGIHAGTAYYDCSQQFTTQLSNILSGYRGGRVVLATPFLLWTKQMVYDFCSECKVPIHFTWSCEVGPSEPCGYCLSCKDREHLNVRASE
jgi:7-cyano-7-deazaguanine synthase